ncbi:LuxR C-terminal-related transcriptional regulator [Neptunitalea lumnitzerae]|uniref:HTH luxR-type domain-containing protein n=1 Tax=Neptunitalea lumnitzerae TaxID=2965509 RepID=A0ABQ5ME58_9FLAO|nr:LuxR C-terminal-related transcriptional regulator [Neptunitalea sp. Y10]GLB47656.1 hypothetical protein Y10_00240 [Neptunitalea sp. Y10]
MKRIVFIIASLLYSVTIAQVQTYPVNNFTVSDYGAANQNWGVSVSNNNQLFVANHQGLLRFDGQHWSLKKLPNGAIVRSVLADNDRVYTGSYEEFGYWKANRVGVYEYTSLTKLIDAYYEFRSEEFWEIVKWNDLVVFRSFRAIYIYDGKTIKVIEPGMVITKIIPWQNQLVIGTEGRGVHAYTKDKGFYRLPGTEVISSLSIADIGVDQSNRLLIGSKFNGVFLLVEDFLTGFSKEINDRLIESQLNKVTVLDDNAVVFGTIKNGLVFYDLTTHAIAPFNRRLGLQNNTVLGLAYKNNKLWVAQDNGISLVDIGQGISFFNEPSGELGTVYDVVTSDGYRYLASNTGVYYFDDKNDLTFLEGSQGHVWGFAFGVAGQLLCCHNKGLFKMNNSEFEQIEGLEGTYTVQEIPGRSSEFLVGTYIGLFKLVYHRMDGAWEVVSIPNMDFPVSSIVFENDKTIWCTHPYKGLYKLTFNDTYTKLSKEGFNDHEVKLTDYQTRIHKVDNTVLFYVLNKWYYYDSDKNEIKEYEPFKKYQNNKLIFNSYDVQWFINTARTKLTYVNDEERITITDKSLLSRMTPMYEKIKYGAGGRVFEVPLNEGYGVLDMEAIEQTNAADMNQKAVLAKVSAGNKLYDVHKVAEIPYVNARSLTFSFGYISDINADFVYELSGPIAQEGDFTSGDITLQNLSYGNYNLSVFLKDSDRQILTYNFFVLPPWYLSKGMIGVYVLLFILLIYGVYWYNERSIKKYHKKLHQKMLEEEEKRKVKLEREALEREVELKQKELMNSTLLISKKNELLLELKNEMKRVKDSPVNEYRVRSLISKTTDAISNKEDWKVFETNFNELHDDFFKKIIKEHPKLTSKDLKLSAYLKMGLMSKEIAPLMGVTTRGVELHRYRLRKKLQLEKEQDLVKYLLLF